MRISKNRCMANPNKYMFNGNISMKFYDMSHFARSNGKETVQRAHCALVKVLATTGLQDEQEERLDAARGRGGGRGRAGRRNRGGA